MDCIKEKIRLINQAFANSQELWTVFNADDLLLIEQCSSMPSDFDLSEARNMGNALPILENAAQRKGITILSGVKLFILAIADGNLAHSQVLVEYIEYWLNECHIDKTGAIDMPLLLNPLNNKMPCKKAMSEAYQAFINCNKSKMSQYEKAKNDMKQK